ncbi:hypothetical protein CLAIMM_12406 [Cladophialophora immunda]|nr:hypothetical protein CLAIMM_12406 [Cladophialophora immunda]
MIATGQTAPLLGQKRIIVTGGGRGIGLALVEAILEAGGQVGILDILKDPHPDCKQLVEKTGKCHYFQCDITKRESLETAFADCVTAMGGHLDGLVTNAGIGTDKPFLEHTWEDYERVVSVNQAGTFFPAQLAVRQFLSQPEPAQAGTRGAIVMIASAAATHDCPGHMLTCYGGTKGFVKSFGVQLAHEIAKTGIRVNSIAPGYIDTPLNQEVADRRPDIKHYFYNAPPMKRLGQPKDIAGGVVFLLSDTASYVTGHNLAIDGGMSTGNGLTR